jgi:hypothetical protein
MILCLKVGWKNNWHIILDVVDITKQTIDNQYFVAKKIDSFKKMLTQILIFQYFDC